MAQTQRKKPSANKKNGASSVKTVRKKQGSRKAASKKNNRSGKSVIRKTGGLSPELRNLMILIAIAAFAVLLFLSSFGLCGQLGNLLSDVFFGLFGITEYVFPILLIVFVVYIFLSVRKSQLNIRRIIGVIGLYVFSCAFLQILMNGYEEPYHLFDCYRDASIDHLGGGWLGGVPVFLFGSFSGIIGAGILIIACLMLFAILTVQALPSVPGNRSSRSKRSSHMDAVEEEKTESEDDQEILSQEELSQKPSSGKRSSGAKRHMSAREKRRQQDEERRRKRAMDKLEAQRIYDEEENKEVSGDESELSSLLEQINSTENKPDTGAHDFGYMPTLQALQGQFDSSAAEKNAYTSDAAAFSADLSVTEKGAEPVSQTEINVSAPAKKKKSGKSRAKKSLEAEREAVEISSEISTDHSSYQIPPLSLLKKGSGGGGPSDKSLRETAIKLEQTLRSFGVDVTMTGYSCGPTVTRFELQPAQGVKVSKIVSLTDDIKLNLAAADIRIEAPIPGKAAVGIEIPNKTNSAVMLRDLLESETFRRSRSKISFALGKDLSGQTVVADIAKMPHLLIAGATGSGKSVCINTIIMSILYHAAPEEVGLIMIDPKVVELSVYNDIPHLLAPVVTDPKKASQTLNWAVAEMTKRYNLFAQYGVRDIKGYNSHVRAIHGVPEEERPERMRQIVIIVDELADLMMVAPGEVEDAICRLAQLARAAGIHLVLATQRPSVNVITGLIKANMPSRIALTVSSGVDSRTIIDSVGAEKLLGHGDMLYYPQGYSKPARVQGAFVSDEEIADVVKYISASRSDQNDTATEAAAAESVKQSAVSSDLQSFLSSPDPSSGDGKDSGRDEYFEEAARLIIDKDKASIGMLQRAFRIGFNRAARIMDQLAEFGVVGGEEGTKPRKILMTKEEFEQRLEG